MQRVRQKLTYANVMATIAVFLAAGGTSYAALQLPRNSVGSKQIRNNAVTSSKVKNHTLNAVDFKAGQLPAGPQGLKGDKGDPGTNGANGTNGTNAATSVVTRVADVSVGSNARSFVTAICPTGERLIAGGASFTTFADTDRLVYSQPSISGTFPMSDGDVPTAWSASGFNGSGAAKTFRAIAICASP